MGWNRLLAGAFVWAVPFALSCCVMKPDSNGKMVRMLDENSFRALMLVSGSFASAYATIKVAPQNGLKGWTTAAVFLFVNWFLDLLVLVPLMIPDTTGSAYITWESWVATVPIWFHQVGLSYVGFVAMCIAAGYTAEATTAIHNKGHRE